MDIAQLFEDLRIINGGAPLGDLDFSPTFERGKQHEQAGGAVAVVFVVVPVDQVELVAVFEFLRRVALMSRPSTPAAGQDRADGYRPRARPPSQRQTPALALG